MDFVPMDLKCLFPNHKVYNKLHGKSYTYEIMDVVGVPKSY